VGVNVDRDQLVELQFRLVFGHEQGFPVAQL
jgi:hypothetical protein